MFHFKLFSHFFKIFFIFIFQTFSCLSYAYSDVAFYVVAHPDDWQLFMGNNAYNDISNYDTKVVIIHTTAGDAKQGWGDYAKARETGAKNAIHFAADALSLPQNRNLIRNQDILAKNGTKTYLHSIARYEYKNTVSYFLRLPDGCYACQGGTALQNLDKLRQNKTETIKALDGSTIYVSWEDLVATLQTILQLEGENISNQWLHHAEIDETINPNDHLDHKNTALAVVEATKNRCINNLRYIEYATEKMKTNLNTEEIMNKSGLFAVYTLPKTEMGFKTDWDKDHKTWVDKQYFSLEIKCLNNFLDSLKMPKRPSAYHIRHQINTTHLVATISLPENAPFEISLTDMFTKRLVARLLVEKNTNIGTYQCKIPLQKLPKGKFLLNLISKNILKKQAKLTIN